MKKTLVDACSYVCRILKVYVTIDDRMTRNDLHNFVIMPVMDVVSYEASHWNIDGMDTDLLLDNLPDSGDEVDEFGSKIAPELALEYVQSQRLYCITSEMLEDAMNNHPLPSKEDGAPRTRLEEFQYHINQMKAKLDIASALLDISTSVQKNEALRTYNDRLCAIVRNIYDNIVEDGPQPTTSVSEDDSDDDDDGFENIDATAEEETGESVDPVEAPAESDDVEEVPSEEEVSDAEDVATEDISSEEEVSEPDSAAEEAVKEKTDEDGPKSESVEDFIAQHVSMSDGVSLPDGSSVNIT